MKKVSLGERLDKRLGEQLKGTMSSCYTQYMFNISIEKELKLLREPVS